MSGRWLFTVMGLSAWCLSNSALAFSDPDRFAEPAEAGGGAGRYFTGAPNDGFGCGVCHTGAQAPGVQLRGLPRNFVPGMTYDLELAWDEPELSHALNLELVHEDGTAAGVLSLPTEAALSPDERCEASIDGSIASKIYAENDRQVVSLGDCGARLLRVRWTAPEAKIVAFSVAIVRSDSSASPQGDGVAEFGRVLVAEGVSRTLSGTCSVSFASPYSLSCYPMVLACVALRVRKTRRQRRRPETVS